MADSPTAAEVARSLADAMEGRGVPYAIGGAIALGFYATPRATVDVDINAFIVPSKQLSLALEALSGAGFVPQDEPATVQAHANTDGQFRGRVGDLRVDVFVPAIPYYAELEKRKRTVTLLGRPACILAPEDLAVLKLMFFRRKDLADVESLLRNQGPTLDRQFVRQKLIELVGADDERIAALNAIERDVDAPD
jgi:hypothetical protein